MKAKATDTFSSSERLPQNETGGEHNETNSEHRKFAKDMCYQEDS
jgi:hypothetical protein